MSVGGALPADTAGQPPAPSITRRKQAMTNKTNKTNARTAVAAVPAWNEAEHAKLADLCKESTGSKGKLLQAVAKVVAEDSPRAGVIRAACGDRGAAALASASRNCLQKVATLAERIATGQPWCSDAGVTEAGVRKEDASIAVCLGGLVGGDARQKAIIAHASKRYTGGAAAQMQAAADALAFFGIIARKDSGRNADYAITDRPRALALLPQSIRPAE
jgi:hypothetical protein